MAKRTSHSRALAPVVRVPAPQIIRVSAPKSTPQKHHKKRRGGGTRVSAKTAILGAATGGLVMGLLDKHLGTSIPTIPMLGRAGTIAAGAYFLAGNKPGIARDVAIAAASVAGYQMGHEGKISGEDVAGVAAQV